MIRHLAFLHQHVRELFLKNCSPEIADPDLRRLARAVASLPDRQHEVFRLARFEGLRPEVIACRLSISQDAANRELVLTLQMIGRSVRRQKRKGW
ncbi:sigma factor-like helix-turn-helix DNA-binding protein [Novosphingobium sp. RD2P27]|uniref:Sigma factor-like helix-turn-helix DNA-binding protein n=1 Tax=Novosphingobium kalidii TaxID=3230299 RepID=A0ABV2D1G8_9SPHN